jgi:hypothetical protein
MACRVVCSSAAEAGADAASAAPRIKAATAIVVLMGPPA